MATGLVNGTDLLLRVGDSNSNEAIIAYSTSCSLEISSDEIDQTNKDSQGWKQIILGTKSWSVSCEALYQNEADSNEDFIDLFDHIAGTNSGVKMYVELAVAGGSSGDANKYYHGEAYVTALSVNGGTEDQATWSVTLVGTGKITESAVA